MMLKMTRVKSANTHSLEYFENNFDLFCEMILLERTNQLYSIQFDIDFYEKIYNKVTFFKYRS